MEQIEAKKKKKPVANDITLLTMVKERKLAKDGKELLEEKLGRNHE